MPYFFQGHLSSLKVTRLKKNCRFRPGLGVNSIPELELQVNSNSGIGIGIEIGGIENGIGIENPGIGIENPGIGIGIENRNWIFCNCYHSIYLLTNHFQILALTMLTEEVMIFHVTDSSCNRYVLGPLPPCGVVTKDTWGGYLVPLE